MYTYKVKEIPEKKNPPEKELFNNRAPFSPPNSNPGKRRPPYFRLKSSNSKQRDKSLLKAGFFRGPPPQLLFLFPVPIIPQSTATSESLSSPYTHHHVSPFSLSLSLSLLSLSRKRSPKGEGGETLIYRASQKGFSSLFCVGRGVVFTRRA